MEGKAIVVGDKFEVESGVFAECPGKSGTARNDCNCRCFLEYKIVSIEEAAELTGKSVEEVRKIAGFTEEKEKESTEEVAENNKNPVEKAEESGIIKLTDDEQYAINRYISSDAYIINEKLRNGTKLTEADKKFIADLDSALNKMPDYKGDLFRSIDITDKEERQKFIDIFSINDKVTFVEYISTSSKDIYNPNADIQIYIINSTKGKDITKYNSNESEVLYMRNSEFKVVNKTEQNGVMHIVLEE